jgi:hypothetical protein
LPQDDAVELRLLFATSGKVRRNRLSDFRTSATGRSR